MDFPDRLTRAIEASGKSQSQLGRETGIPQSAISAMTQGKRRPYLDQAAALAAALGIPLSGLSGEIKTDHPPPGLSDEEWSVIVVFRALRLSPDEAIRRLSGLAPDSADEGRRLPGSGRGHLLNG